MRRALRGVGIAFAIIIGIVAIAFALLLTPPGRNLLASAISRMASAPNAIWQIDGLGGIVPFRVTATRITLRDDDGVWLTLRDAELDIDPAALLAGELRIRLLKAAEVEKARPAVGPSTPLTELLRVPHLPIAVIVDRLVLERLVLGAPVLGARAVATVRGDAAVRGATARTSLDIHRIDGQPGNIVLKATLAGAQPRLGLQLQASDPTGIIADHIFGRADHLPAALSLDGDGPISGWQGRLAASVGREARLDADLMLAMGNETAIGMTARANIAPLLRADLAAAVGDRETLSLHAILGDRIAVDRLSFAAASVAIEGSGTLGKGPDGVVSARLHAAVPDFSKFDRAVGGGLRGSAALGVEISGSKRQPAVKAEMSASEAGGFGISARQLTAQISANPTGVLDDPQTRIAIAGQGRLTHVAVPAGGALAARIGERIDWSLDAIADPVARMLDLKVGKVKGVGVGVNAAGHLAVAENGVLGSLQLSGDASDIGSGIAAIDALLGRAPMFAGTIRRDAAGIVTADDFELSGGAARLAGNARFDPASKSLTAALALDIPQLALLRPAIGSGIGGSLSVKTTVKGPVDQLQLHSEIDARDITVNGAAIDRLQLSGVVANLSQPKAAIDGSFRAGRLEGRLALTAAPIAQNGLAVSNLRLTAADSSIAGDLRVGFTGPLVEGSLRARFPDLSRWSALAGKPVGGSLDLTAGLSAAKGAQGLDLTINGSRLAVGAGQSGMAIGRLAATARLTDLWRRPTGSGRFRVDALHSGPFDFSSAGATFDSRSPGRFAFQGNAAGHPLSFALAGEAGPSPGGGDLRLTRLAGSLDKEDFALEQPLELTRRGSDLSLSRSALRFGSSRIVAGGAIRGEALALGLNVSNLSIAAAARLAGYPEIHGKLSLAANLAGTLRAPRGRLALEVAGLALSVSRQAQTPRLGLSVNGDWDGRALDFRGQVTGLKGDRIAVTGSLPLLLSPAPVAVSVPPQGRLAVNLQGGGDIGHLVDLLPLGEDRLSGKFALDASLGGTLAAPSASGRLSLTGARYENFASGAVLADLQAELVGNGDRFRLVSLTAGDGAGGSLTAQGSLALGGTEGANAQLSAKLAHFRIAARDELLATASGAFSVAGPLAAPKVTAPLTIDRAEINLPSRLPPNVVVLKVTEVNGRRPTAQSQSPAPSTPAIPAELDITLGLPGPVMVQGLGLDSQWSGHLRITGTTVAPKISGTLVANRGSYTLLGKNFRLTRGTIAFDGSAKIDPALDIVAEASAADITAQVMITGYASAPVISLTSSPLLPQDEILARVLFGSGVRQMTAGQGLQLAQAAAALSGKDPGVLDRLRGGLGLDWLRLGQGPAGAASSILNPSVVTPTTQSTAALSAGKYIAPGVSVGVTQGVSPPTSKVTVEVDVGHHLTVDTEAGQNSGTGVGLNYNFDY